MTRGPRAVINALFGKRKSIVRQTSFLFALISLLVLAGMGFSIDRMLATELLESNDVLLLGNMSLIRNRLARLGPPESTFTSRQFFEDTGMGYRRLALAFLDENRRVLQASEGFNIPVAALPEKVLPIEAIPERVDRQHFFG